MLLVALLAWTTFAFGGVYASTLVIPALLLAALALTGRPAVLRRGQHADIDRWSALAFTGALLQLVPLPRAVIETVSPAAIRVAEAMSLVDRSGPLPFAVDLQDAAGGALVLGCALLLFAIARQIFATGGIRTVARGLASTAIVLACIAIAQDATGQGLMYWRFKPVFERAFPFGPFVNRNHFGTWAIMVVPLCIGYLVAHTAAHAHSGRGTWRQRVVAVLDGRTWLLLAAIVLLIVATVVSLSRSSILGLACALAIGGLLAAGRTRETSREPRALVVIAVVAAAALGATLLRVEPASVSDRIAATGVGLSGRMEIWTVTIHVIRDFWLTGTGVGTYQTAMALYQQPTGGLIFNQAHNHYLQVAAEGGLLVGVPVALGLLALANQTFAALRQDRSGMYWLRVGAASGLAGVAVQSIFEAGLLTPANAAVAAVLAAIVVHVPARVGPGRSR